MKKKRPKPIPFEDVDVVRKTIVWHAREIFDLHKQLEPHKTERAIVGGTNEAGDSCFVIFKGTVEDLFKLKEFLEK